MARSNDGISTTIKRLSTPKVNGLSLTNLLRPVAAVSPGSNGSAKTLRPPSLGDLISVSMAGVKAPTGISFGRPSNAGTSSQESSSGVGSSILKQAASGGVASVLSGGLGSILGIGGLVSGLVNLFGGGGKSAPPPLVQFQLPDPQSQTIYLSSNNSASSSGGQPLQYQSAQIADAVKKALLNSSSLNDVIAEI